MGVTRLAWPVVVTVCAILRARGYAKELPVAVATGLLLHAIVYSASTYSQNRSGSATILWVGNVVSGMCVAVWFTVLSVHLCQSDEARWYAIYYDWRAWYLYTLEGILLFIVLLNLEMFASACSIFVPSSFVFRGPGTNTTLNDKIYARRCALVNSVIAICAGLSAYYIDIVVSFVMDNNTLGMYNTTYYSSLNKTQCEETGDVATDHDDALYTENTFTPDCAVVVWSRNRTNVLVWTQLIVVFSFLADIPHYAKADGTRKALYYLMMTVGNIALVAAVVTTVDLLASWYDISTLGATLFSIYGLSRVVAALSVSNVDATRIAQMIRNVPSLTGASGDDLKDVKLKL